MLGVLAYTGLFVIYPRQLKHIPMLISIITSLSALLFIIGDFSIMGYVFEYEIQTKKMNSELLLVTLLGIFKLVCCNAFVNLVTITFISLLLYLFLQLYCG